MRILIIGDYPKFNGGVTNYTHPLAVALSRSTEVYYLYSCTRTENYDLGKMRIVQRNIFPDSSVSYFELVNPPTRYYNYDNLKLDVENWFDKTFNQFIKKIRPEIVHVHEIFGFSSRILSNARKNNIKVFVTVHEYWWLCPHRVMVDFNKKICSGPYNINKCTFCVESTHYKRKSTLKIIIKNNFKWIHNFYMKKIKGKTISLTTSLEFGTHEFPNVTKNDRLYNSILNRLTENLKNLNTCNIIIAVSNDVKEKLTQYGVNPSLIKVQHIGSVIAEKINITNGKRLNKNKITFGFIGGITYYKGVHQLVDAYLKMDDQYKEKSELIIYGKYDIPYYNSIVQNLLTNNPYSHKVMFKGKFTAVDLENIYNSIDISILPSLCADTAPQTIFESFSGGLPVIAPSIGGFTDFVFDNFNGLLYEGASVEALRYKLQYVISNPNIIAFFKNNIVKPKTLKQNIEELLDFYKSA